MEVAEAVAVEIGNVALEKDPAFVEASLNPDKENEIVDNGIDALQINSSAINAPLLTSEGISSSAVEAEVTTATAHQLKVSTHSKKIGTSKVQKDGGRNGNTTTTKKDRFGLSQSVSFPARSSVASGLRKSTTALVKQTKGDSKKLQSNGLNVDNGALRSRHPAAVRKSLPLKSGLVDRGDPFEAIKANSGDMNPLKQIVSAKSDDDANSTTSSTPSRVAAQRKSSASGFSFRLDERAEKRKEFFMKIEEKVHAKEVENTNLQEKSKESQEAEIRKLRKSLTFKAAPMPSFYQEPGPPKVELKKIPPTRARSPKLGRRKPSTAAATNSSEGIVSSLTATTANPIKSNKGAANGNSGSLAAKEPIQKSLPKLTLQKSTATRADAKTLSSKPKVVILKEKRDTRAVEDRNATVKEDDTHYELRAKEELDSLEITTEVNETVLSSAEPGFDSNEVIEVLNEISICDPPMK